MHNRTKHCSNCVCIRSVWYYIGKQCWTTHFHFTEQENRASVMLAGEDKSDTPWEPSHLYWTANVTKRAPIKRAFHDWELLAGRTTVIIFTLCPWTHTVIFPHATGDEEEPFLWTDCQNWVVKIRIILQACAKHLGYMAYVTTSIKRGSNRRSATSKTPDRAESNHLFYNKMIKKYNWMGKGGKE